MNGSAAADRPMWEVSLNEGVAHASPTRSAFAEELFGESGGGGGIVIISVGPSGDLLDWSSLTQKYPEIERLEIDSNGADDDEINSLRQAAGQTGHPVDVLGQSGDSPMQPG